MCCDCDDGRAETPDERALWAVSYALSDLRGIGKLSRGFALTDSDGQPVEATLLQPLEGASFEMICEEIEPNKYRVFAYVPLREGKEWCKEANAIAQLVNNAPAAVRLARENVARDDEARRVEQSAIFEEQERAEFERLKAKFAASADTDPKGRDTK